LSSTAIFVPLFFDFSNGLAANIDIKKL